MRQWLADAAFAVSKKYATKAEQSRGADRYRLNDRASIWHSRHLVLAGLRTVRRHRKAVRDIKARAKRRARPPAFTRLDYDRIQFDLEGG